MIYWLPTRESQKSCLDHYGPFRLSWVLALTLTELTFIYHFLLGRSDSLSRSGWRRRERIVVRYEGESVYFSVVVLIFSHLTLDVLGAVVCSIC